MTNYRASAPRCRREIYRERAMDSFQVVAEALTAAEEFAAQTGGMRWL
jgi:hypothetical protein